MKSEERHQLQKNELAKLGDKVSQLMKADFWDKYSNHILIGVSVVCLGLAGWIYWSRHTYARTVQAWRDMSVAQEAAEYSALLDSHANSPVAPWAALKAAEMRLSDGTRKMFTDREAAATDLSQSQTLLDDLLVPSQTPEIRKRALFLMAQCLETQNKLDEAAEHYEQLLKDFPASAHVDVAKERLKSIRSGSAKEFYGWFKSQKPKPVEPPKPKDASADPTFPDLHPLPELAPDDGKPSAGGKTTEEKTTEEKTTEENPALKSPGDAPGDKESSGEKPSDASGEPKGETPATPAPGEVKPENPAEPTEEDKKPEAPSGNQQPDSPKPTP